VLPDNFTNKVYMVSKNDTGVAHYNFTAHQPILVIIGEMLLRDHAIESLFVTAPLLSNITRAVATFEAPRRPPRLFSQLLPQ